MDEEKIDTYSTKVESQQDLEISFKDSGFEDVIDENGVIPTTLNVPVMVQRLAKDIYKNATSGIRELYMNAVRGCVDGVEQFGYKDPHIKVTINEGERIIIIEDNGRGITKARFKQVLRELGTSDNFEGTVTGQFGMGFASYMTLASVVVLDTIGDNGDNYKMLCRDGTSSKYAGKSDLDEHGTKLTLTCYEEVDFDAVCEKLYDTARHASVPTTVIIEEFEYTPDNFNEGSNEIEQVRFDDNVPEAAKEAGIVKIETEDFTLLASDWIASSDHHTYLLNVPIDSEIDLPFYYWTLNIKDERKYQPMPDRDRMREESDEAIEAHVKDALREYFQDLDIKNYDDYINSDRRQEFIWLIEHQEYAPEALQQTLLLLNGASGLRKVSYTDKNASTHSLVYWLRASGAGGITYQGYKNKAYTDKVRQYIDEKCQLLIVRKGKQDNWAESVKVLEQFGVPTVKQILKDNKVKMPKGAQGGSEKMIVAHNHKNRGYDTNDTYLDEVGVEAVRADTIKMSKLISFVREYPTDMVFMRNEPALKDTDCQKFSEWIEEFKTVEVMTNKGLIRADALAREEEIAYCSDLEEEFLPLVEDADELLILDNTKVVGVALLKHLEYEPEKWIGGLVDTVWLDSFIKKKYGIDMYSDNTKRFFCEHLKEVKPVFHELFVRVLKQINDNFADKVADTQREKYLNIFKEYGVLETDDEISKLKFYHAKWQNLPNKQAGITRIFQELVDKTKEIIHDNSFLLNKFVQEEVLVKAFGAVEVRKCQLNTDYSYADTCTVSFTTNLRTLNFNGDLKVYDMGIKLAHINIRIFKNHSLITAKVEVST